MLKAFGAGILMLAIAAPVSAESRSYDLKGFTRIEASKGFDIEFIQAPTFSVKVNSRYNNLDQIVVEKVGDTLRISRPDNFCVIQTRNGRTTMINGKSRGDCLDHDVDDAITITAPDLDAVKFHAGIRFSADTLKVDAFEIKADAGVSVDIRNLAAGPVDVQAHAGTRILLSGSCSKLAIDLGAGSNADARALKCREATVDAAAASNVRAYASDKVVAKAGAVSNIVISGKPKDFQKSEDGFSARISQED